MKRTKQAESERQEAIADLRKWLKPGDTLYTILDHVSASGMSRAIRVVVPMIHVKDGTLNPDSPSENYAVDFRHPNYAVGKALDLKHWKQNGREQDALVIGGSGMDMGFHLTYNLGHVLWPDGYPCSGASCCSNDHDMATATGIERLDASSTATADTPCGTSGSDAEQHH